MEYRKCSCFLNEDDEEGNQDMYDNLKVVIENVFFEEVFIEMMYFVQVVFKVNKLINVLSVFFVYCSIGD